MKSKTLLFTHCPLAGLATMLYGCLSFATPTVLASPDSEGQVVVDWGLQLAGEAPSSDVFERARITSWEGRGRVEMLVVDETTDPASPLPEGRPALMVKLVDGEAAVGGVQFKPFVNPPLQGWMEFEAVLDDSLHLTVTARNESDSDDPADPGGRQFFHSSLRPDSTVSLRVEPGIQLGSEPDKLQYLTIPATVPPGTPTSYAVVWDFKSDPATIGFRVHGDWGGDPLETIFQFEVNPEAARRGLDAFTIGGNGFIGNISVSAGE